MNYRLTLQYDGTDFNGWQVQAAAGGRTVQGELRRVLSLLDGRGVEVHGAGRTDTGVHAEAQVASVRLRREFAPVKLCAAVNGNLAPDLRVTAAEAAPDEFHARFSARGKTYRYRVFNAPFMSPFLARFAHQEARQLDLARMRACARLFVGEHDWTAFSAAQSEVKTRVRRVTRCEVSGRWCEEGRGRVIEITVSAEGFLRYMARSMAGALLAAGRGEIDEGVVARALEGGGRPPHAVTAPARGLTLVEVHY